MGPHREARITAASLTMSWFASKDNEDLVRKLDELQMEDTLRLNNSITERCFFNCVNSFTSSELDSHEELCVQRCVQKFATHLQRVGRNFAEQQALEMDQHSASTSATPPSLIAENMGAKKD